MESVTDVHIVKEISLNEASLRLRKDGIVHVIFNKDVTLDVDLQMKLFHLYHELTHGKKMPFVFSAFDGITVTKEARDNAIKIEDDAPVSAVAVIADSLAYRLIANFYLKVNKPKSPYKVFTNLNDALEWLAPFKSEL
jgi:hypothetical protein